MMAGFEEAMGVWVCLQGWDIISRIGVLTFLSAKREPRGGLRYSHRSRRVVSSWKSIDRMMCMVFLGIVFEASVMKRELIEFHFPGRLTWVPVSTVQTLSSAISSSSLPYKHPSSNSVAVGCSFNIETHNQIISII